jgi:hypothetical protein
MFATGFLWPIMLPAWWIKNWNDSGGLVEFIVPSLKKEQQEKERADIAAKGRKETVDLYKKLNLEIPEWLK